MKATIPLLTCVLGTLLCPALPAQEAPPAPAPIIGHLAQASAAPPAGTSTRASCRHGRWGALPALAVVARRGAARPACRRVVPQDPPPAMSPVSEITLGGGPAPLTGTQRNERLMYSLPVTTLSQRLVKAEWDVFEEWAQLHPDKRN